MRKKIEDRRDVELLVDRFYEKVKTDKIIGFIFNDIVRVKWERHLPTMYDFWENTLFYTGNYNGNPMEMHTRLNKLIPLTPRHFERWTDLFTRTVDELFIGEKADLAKQRAVSIATVMQIKILQKPGEMKK